MADNIPALLSEGEVVLNKNQQKSLGKLLGVSPSEALKAIGVPGFEHGGLVKKYEYGGRVSPDTLVEGAYSEEGASSDALLRRLAVLKNQALEEDKQRFNAIEAGGGAVLDINKAVKEWDMSKAGGYKGGFMKFVTEDPKITGEFMEKGVGRMSESGKSAKGILGHAREMINNPFADSTSPAVVKPKVVSQKVPGNREWGADPVEEARTSMIEAWGGDPADKKFFQSMKGKDISKEQIASAKKYQKMKKEALEKAGKKATTEGAKKASALGKAGDAVGKAGGKATTEGVKKASALGKAGKVAGAAGNAMTAKDIFNKNKTGTQRASSAIATANLANPEPISRWSIAALTSLYNMFSKDKKKPSFSRYMR